MPTPTQRWDLFCRVIDNHGDLGVCWRLARALADAGDAVRLWVDDASALAWMAPDVLMAPTPAPQQATPAAGHVRVLPWPETAADQASGFDAVVPGDVVIEAFGCDPPPAFLAAMARRATTASAPVWINLEYLSAEPFVARSHGLASPQFSGPAKGLSKWFFFPGFTEDTGGLLHGGGARRPAVGAAAAGRAPRTPVAAPSPGHGLGPAGQRILVFGYPAAGWGPTLSALARRAAVAGPTELLLPPGGLRDAVALALGAPRRTDDPAADAALTWRPLAPVPQTDFDALLGGCDLVIVRGEDSFVRAQVASATPFLWQVYPQADGAHVPKLEAFLALYLAAAPPPLDTAIGRLFRAVNGLADWPPGDWPDPLTWRAHHARWRDQLLAQDDLLTRLRRFVQQHGGLASTRSGPSAADVTAGNPGQAGLAG